MKKLIQNSKFISALLIPAFLAFIYTHQIRLDPEADKTNEERIFTDTDPDTSRDAEGDTFSIVAYDKTTGQVGGAGCSCVSISGGIDFLSDLITDGTTSPNNIVGAIHSQASYNATTQGWARDRMLAGDTPQQIINFVVANDGGSASRQYGVVGVDVPGAAGWTGSSNGNFANDIQVDNSLFTISVQGNILDTSNGPDILNDIRDAFLNTDGTLGDRLMAALQGAKRVGGDNRCASRGNSGRTAFVQVLSPGENTPSLFFTTGNAVIDGIEPIDVLQCQYDASITPPTCRGTVNTFPYIMDFEDQVWIKDESNCGPEASTNSWIRSRFSTPTANTGPGGASQGNLYMFVEADQGTNDRAIIKSPCFDLPTGQSLQLSFDYHMFGSNMGSLALTINDGTGWTTLWSASGNQGNAWQTQQLDLSSYQGSTVSFRFDATTGNGVESDMGIDNISIAEAGVIICANTVDTFPYDESFESSFGVWSQSAIDDLDWTRDSNGTPSSNTGPSSAFDGSVYIYVEASGNGTGYPNKRAIIESPCFDFTDKTSANFSFNYHMFGASDMGSINLEISTNGGVSWSSIWSLTGNQGNQWFAQNIDLALYLGEAAVQLRFNRLTGSTWQADIALDNFNLTATGGPDITPPTAPTNLAASNTTETSTSLSWTASTDNIGVTGYDIYEGGTVIGSASGTNFDVTGLSPSTSYSFTVVAKDAAGNESAPSNPANVTTLTPPDTEAPTAPTGLSASNTTMISTDLSWTASTDNVGVVGYDVYEGASLIGSATTVSFSVTGLSPATSYTFTVVAKDAAGNESVPSNPLGVTTMSDTIAPSAPTNLTASNTTQTTTDLSWNASTDNVGVTGYDILEGVTVIGTTTGTQFNVTGLSPSTSYSFTVLAKDAAGNESAPSNAVNVTTLSPPDTTPPTQPTNLAAANTTMVSTDLSWTASTDNVGVTGYDVYLGASVLGTTSGTTFGVTGLSPGLSYTFTVVAKDAAGNESIPSDPLQVVTMSDTISPSAPTNLTASNTTQTTTDLNWDPATDNVGVTGYDVYEGATVIGTVASTAFNVSGLSPSTAYVFTVVAKDAAGNESPASNTANVTTADASVGCTGGILAFPYSQGFEGTIGDWTQVTSDDLDWLVNSGGTPSNNTGPVSADEGSFYIYVEASGNGTGYPNKQAVINSPCYDLSSETFAVFSFSVHQFGSSDMGSISLEASGDDGQTWDTLWNQAGNQGDIWQNVNIDLAAYLGGGVQLRLNRITGSTWQADIAIDNILLINTEGSGCAGGLSLPYNESFESGIGAWSQDSNDDLDWIRLSNSTPSNNTGPSSASAGNFYMYVEASGNGTGYPGKRAILNSPCLDLSTYSTASITFDYHMWGTTDMGSITMQVSTDDGFSWQTLWSQTVNQGQQWNTQSVDLTPFTGKGVLLRFDRVTGGTWRADVAIDNIAVTGSMNMAPFSTNDPLDRSNNNVDFIPSFRLYPNPVNHGVLHFSLNTAMKSYTVYNVSGQRLLNGGIGTEYIDVSTLPSGVYLIEFTTDYGNMNGQFIVE
jgi:chitodextrinase/uncharacterized Ntn-hydrolase superfamily protein